jgi:hypothetical protein
MFAYLVFINTRHANIPEKHSFKSSMISLWLDEQFGLLCHSYILNLSDFFFAKPQNKNLFTI